VGCYIWYSEEGPGRATSWHYNCLCTVYRVKACTSLAFHAVSWFWKLSSQLSSILAYFTWRSPVRDNRSIKIDPRISRRRAVGRVTKGGPTIRCRSRPVTRQNRVSMSLTNDRRVPRLLSPTTTVRSLYDPPRSPLEPRQTVANNFMP